MTGAVEKAEGSITVTPPSELDNADPFVLDTMTVRVPTKIIGRTVEYNRADLNEEACAGMVKVQEEMLSNAKITALSKGPNVASWNSYLAKYLNIGATWSALPWCVAETSSRIYAYILYIICYMVFVVIYNTQYIIHNIQYTGTSQRPMSITVFWRPQAPSQKCQKRPTIEAKET